MIPALQSETGILNVSQNCKDLTRNLDQASICLQHLCSRSCTSQYASMAHDPTTNLARSTHILRILDSFFLPQARYALSTSQAMLVVHETTMPNRAYHNKFGPGHGDDGYLGTELELANGVAMTSTRLSTKLVRISCSSQFNLQPNVLEAWLCPKFSALKLWLSFNTYNLGRVDHTVSQPRLKYELIPGRDRRLGMKPSSKTPDTARTFAQTLIRSCSRM